MIEIRVTKEIRDFEPKVIGPFTFRQLACLAVGAPICYVILKYFSPIITMDLAAFLCVPVAALAYLIGWYEPYGMKTEQFIRSIFVTRLLAPSARKYKTVNAHEALLKQLTEIEAAYSAADEDKKKGKKGQSDHKRYKLSPKAYR